MRRIVLKNHQSPGDCVVLTAALRDLHATHPGQFETAIDSSCQWVFAHNPHVVPAEMGMDTVEVHYPSIKQSNTSGLHFVEGLRNDLADTLGVRIEPGSKRPALYLSPAEQRIDSQVKRDGRPLWLLNAGSKPDFDIKQWSHARFQAVVDALPDIHFVQVGQLQHEHPRLRNCTDLIGRTSLRQLLVLAWHCDGILTGNSLLMHVAAAWAKPAVVISGGREPVSWCQYEGQTFLHTIGQLDCCASGGCWKWRIAERRDGLRGPESELLDNRLCKRPVVGEHGQPQAECMTLLTSEQVTESIRDYAHATV